MKKYCTVFLLLALLGLWSTAVAADELGNKIAQTLCYPRSSSITLSPIESAQYDAAPSITGQYSTVEGTANITAKFTKRSGSANCERSISESGPNDGMSSMWPISKDGNILRRTTFSGGE